MKLTKKKVLVFAAIVCVIAILSTGSLAWFNAEAEVENTFKVADSESDPDKVFSIAVLEHGTDGTGEGSSDGNTYEDILPGSLVNKDPYAQNTGYYTQYVKMVITSDADWLDATTTLYSCLENVDAANWIYDSTNSSPDEAIFYYNSTLAAEGETTSVFTKLQVPTGMDQTELTDFTVTATAYAVQVDNILTAEELAANTTVAAQAQVAFGKLS